MNRPSEVVIVHDRKFMVHFDPETSKPRSVDAQVVRRTGHWRQTWHRMFAKPPSAAVKQVLEAVTGSDARTDCAPTGQRDDGTS